MTPLEEALVALVEDLDISAGASEDGGESSGLNEAARKLERILIHECVIEGKV